MRLFVYGTLLGVSGTRMAGWLERRLVCAVPATVPGRIIAVRCGAGWYPALMPAHGGRRVRGMLVTLALRPGDLALLDRYEGREYRRVAVRARTAKGMLFPAQAYRWRMAPPRGSIPIRNGDFIGWLALTGRRPFAARGDGRRARPFRNGGALAKRGVVH